MHLYIQHDMGEIRKIVVAVDSFKGCATSRQIARAAAEGIHSVMPECEVAEVPVGDGGEGTVAAIVDVTGGRWVECRVHGPLGGKVDARYCILSDGTAAIEMAAAAGLTLIPATERNPLYATTCGVGEMMADAIGRGCRNFLIFLGGSATNDAATGMLDALGYRFIGGDGLPLSPMGATLKDIRKIDSSGVLPQLADCRFTVACDVRNPFFGPDGAACVFAPQKGATPEDVRRLDAGLRNFASVLKRTTGVGVATMPGAGAAGGMGGGLAALLGAQLKPGIEMVLDAIDFDRILDNADFVITGEGRIDAQTALGKTPFGVMLRARRLGIPTIAIGGSVTEISALTDAGFTAVFPVLPYPCTLAEAMDQEFTLENVRRTVTQLTRILCSGTKRMC